MASYSGSWNGQPAVWAGRRTPDGRDEIYVRDSYAPQRQELSDLRQTVIEVAVAAAVGGALLGLLLAGGLSLRLRRAASIAERVTAGELDARINATGHDEVAKLGEAIDRMAEAMRLRIERERRFVADVAHDLRTPLTGLKTASSLLDHDQVGDAIRERVDRLLRLVEDLLEISRLDSGTATADLRWVDLGGFVTERGRRRAGDDHPHERRVAQAWSIPAGWSASSRTCSTTPPAMARRPSMSRCPTAGS